MEAIYIIPLMLLSWIILSFLFAIGWALIKHKFKGGE
jgi:hypothetical protein